MSDALLTEAEAARYLSISPHTLRHIRLDGEGPQHCFLGKSAKYRIDWLDSWVDGKASKRPYRKRAMTCEPVKCPHCKACIPAEQTVLDAVAGVVFAARVVCADCDYRFDYGVILNGGALELCIKSTDMGWPLA